MRVDRFITLQIMSRLYSGLTAGTAPPLPVLMYHSISEESESLASPYYRVATSPRRFAEQMAWLAESGLKGVALEDALPPVSSDRTLNPSHVALTFDDGFRNFYSEAWPVLKKHGFSATMYLPTEYISNKRKQFRNTDCLNWREVRELRVGGIRFGSHTVTHPKLHGLGWQTIEVELTESKVRIERELKESVTSFAYPYAFPQEDRKFVEGLVRLLKRLGYSNCATTQVGRHRPEENPFLVRRLPVNSLDDRLLFTAKLLGHYDWVSLPQSSFRWGRSLAKRLPGKRTAIRANQSQD